MKSHVIGGSGLGVLLVLDACGTENPAAPPAPIMIAVFTGTTRWMKLPLGSLRSES